MVAAEASDDKGAGTWQETLYNSSWHVFSTDVRSGMHTKTWPAVFPKSHARRKAEKHVLLMQI